MCKIRQKLPAFGRQCVQLKPCLQKCDQANKHSSQLSFTPFSKTQINSTISTHFETAFLLASEGLDQTAHKRRLHAFLHTIVDLIRVTPPIPATVVEKKEEQKRSQRKNFKTSREKEQFCDFTEQTLTKTKAFKNHRSLYRRRTQHNKQKQHQIQQETHPLGLYGIMSEGSTVG